MRGLPLVKPPWGRISAIDLKTGDILWQIPHGETPDNVRNHPALRRVDIPRTGRIGRVGTLITKTLVIAGEPGTFTTSSGEVGAMLRAYDKVSGEEVGAIYMPTGVTGSPMTYMHKGRQYIAMAIGGAGFPGELISHIGCRSSWEQPVNVFWLSLPVRVAWRYVIGSANGVGVQFELSGAGQTPSNVEHARSIGNGR